MSNEAISWAYRQPIESAGRKFVLVALADFADESWTCFPGQERIAQMTGQNVRSVRRHIEDLEADGYITRERRFLRNGQRTSDRYAINRGAAAELPIEGIESTPQPPDNLTGGQSDLRSLSTPPPDTVSGYPLENPQIPPQPPASGGRVCTRHQRPRSGCADCATPKPTRPPWCGQCDKDTRLIEVSDSTMARCKACHPKAWKAAS